MRPCNFIVPEEYAQEVAQMLGEYFCRRVRTNPWGRNDLICFTPTDSIYYPAVQEETPVYVWDDEDKTFYRRLE